MILALSRRLNEAVVIGDPRTPIGTIRVVAIGSEVVRLVFDFPHEISVNREELAVAKAKGIAK